MKQPLYKRNPDVVFYSFDTEAYLLDEKNDQILTLNETSSELWSQLKKPVDMHQLESAFAKKYTVSDQEIQRDIARMLKIFLEKKLITKTTKK